MLKKRVRNFSFVPLLGEEGTFQRPMPSPPKQYGREDEPWHANLATHDRLFYHQTLSSVRSCRRFLPTRKLPRDELDFVLQSRYNHSAETFPEKVDAVLQPESCFTSSVQQSFRTLRNTKIQAVEERTRFDHPLVIGGCKEKPSPHSVKLIYSGLHTQFVNNGFSRQPANGNFFHY